MIEVHDLTKRYGARTAVDGLSFSIDKGEIVGFLGPNGAGKSTTLRILAGYLAPTSGQAKIAGIDVLTRPLEAKAQLGYMPEAVPLYPEMRVVEYLGFRAEAKGVARAQRRARIAECMEKAKLAEVANVVTGALSKGFKQRVGLADALLAKPQVLLLDEPTAGLDPNQIREVRALLGELAKEHTVLLSTHILSEVEAACSRAIVVHRGKLIAAGTLAEIRERHAPTVIEASVRGDRSAVHKLATELGAKVHSASDSLHTLRVPRKDADLDALAERTARAIVSAGIELRELSRGRFALEEVFADLTRSERDARDADDTNEAHEGDAEEPS